MYVKARVKIYNGEKVFGDVAIVDTGITGLIIDELVAEELGLKVFGEVEVATLGSTIKCGFIDVENVVIEEAEIGPRRILVCKFPEEVKKKLKSMGFSDKAILGVSVLEDAGYVPNTGKGVLEKVGFFAL